MRVLLDTNVILDILLKRQPFVEHAKMVLQTAQQGQCKFFMTATTVTDVYYLARKAKGKAVALEFIEDFLQYVEVAAIDKGIILQALRSEIGDFEDAIQECAAQNEAITIIVTRNTQDFKKSDREIHSPESFVKNFLESSSVED